MAGSLKRRNVNTNEFDTDRQAYRFLLTRTLAVCVRYEEGREVTRPHSEPTVHDVEAKMA
jgi:hypothetical protein